MTNPKKPKPRILVVDDSRVMRHAVAKILGDNYDVIEAGHGEDAWTLLTHDERIQVVFTDLSMPYLDGYGLLERIRFAEDERLANLPVIIITGKEDDEAAKHEALTKGATDFISKPFDSIQLLARAKAHVRFEETSRQLSRTTATLEMEAAIDTVTGLGSRIYFMKSANEALAYARRHESRLILVRLDIDAFNKLFIRNGREAANLLLESVGGILSRTIRQEDKAARTGLASFAFLLQSTLLDEAHQLAERIREEVEKFTFQHDGHPLRATVSIGLTESVIDKDTRIEGMLEEAELYLATADTTGGNQVISHLNLAQIDAGNMGAQANRPPDIPEALSLLRTGQTDRLKPHLDALLTQLQPLLRFLAEHSEADIKAGANTLLAQIDTPQEKT